jgi:soluble lytic murein transglycosylase-like protein
MDSTVVVVLLFVFTILSSFGGNKGYTPPPAHHSSSSAGALSQMRVQDVNINPKFLAVDVGTAKTSIKKYVSCFRSDGEAQAITDSIMRYSQIHNVNPKLVAALMRRESGFNPRAVSSAGAMGLGQLMRSTCRTTGVTQPFDIDQNTMGTVRYMKYLLDRFENNAQQIPFSLAGYLEGPNAVERNRGYRSSTAGYVKDIIGIYHDI